jgi:hypothetical protein
MKAACFCKVGETLMTLADRVRYPEFQTRFMSAEAAAALIPTA